MVAVRSDGSREGDGVRSGRRLRNLGEVEA
jgi:hypothetical protein